MNKNLKKIIKKNELIFKINAVYKCLKVKKQYLKIVNHYKKKEQEYDLENLLIQRGFAGEWISQFDSKKPRIFYLGTDEFQDKSGFLQALSKMANVDVFYKEDGVYGQYKRNQNPIISNRKRLLELFDELNKSNNLPDILLMQTWEWRIGIKTLLELKQKYSKLKIINISMDDRHTFYDYGNPVKGTFGLIPAIDLALTSAKETVDWYLKENIPALYFPEASSFDFYYPMNINKKYDVGFVGAKYGIRSKIIKELLANGINVKTYGTGWNDGRLPIEETNHFFNECKIILGVGTIGYCEDFFALKLRDFDAPMSGSCYVTHDNNDLHTLYKKDVEIVLCSTVHDYVNKIKDLLLDDDKLNKISYAGLQKVKNKHTYENRFLKLFNSLNIHVHK